jgi:hypothetical protein
LYVVVRGWAIPPYKVGRRFGPGTPHEADMVKNKTELFVLRNKARTHNMGDSSNNQSGHDVGGNLICSHTYQTFHELRNPCNNSKTVKTAEIVKTWKAGPGEYEHG